MEWEKFCQKKISRAFFKFACVRALAEKNINWKKFCTWFHEKPTGKFNLKNQTFFCPFNKHKLKSNIRKPYEREPKISGTPKNSGQKTNMNSKLKIFAIFQSIFPDQLKWKKFLNGTIIDITYWKTNWNKKKNFLEFGKLVKKINSTFNE